MDAIIAEPLAPFLRRGRESVASLRSPAILFHDITVHRLVPGALRRGIGDEKGRLYATTAVASISTFARSSINPLTTTTAIAGKCFPITSRQAWPISRRESR
jgi:hypothetical protein